MSTNKALIAISLFCISVAPAGAVPVFERSDPEQPTVQYVDPSDMLGERGPSDLDSSLSRLSLSLVNECIVNEEHRRLMGAYLNQLRQADSESCASNLYFTDPDIVYFVRGLSFLAPIENAPACKALDDSLKTVFEEKERDALETGVCHVKRPLPRCKVTGDGLRFRMFPHINNHPEVNGNLFTRLDGLSRGTTVVLGKAYRGWAKISASLPELDGKRSSGWVSLQFLDCE